MLELFFDPQAWVALITLTLLEIVLGIDNLVFISVLVSRLPASKAERVRKIGLSLALVFRILLLGALSWIMGLTAPIVQAYAFSLSWRDLILIAGGLFLIGKATHEIHAEVEGENEEGNAIEPAPGQAGRRAIFVIGQLIVIDLVFSLDSIITAIGLVDDIEIMVVAIVIAMLLMYAASGAVGKFIREHPTTKMLALAFLVMIGAALIADGFHFHIPRGYIYSAMGFSVAVEFFNIMAKRSRRRKSAR